MVNKEKRDVGEVDDNLLDKITREKWCCPFIISFQVGSKTMKKQREMKHEDNKIVG